MKRYVLTIGLTAALTVLASSFNCAEAQSFNQTSVQKALQDRHSIRSYADKQLSEQTLSNLLWAANGVNRKDGRRTAPSAINAQDIELYVNKADGVYHYAAADKKLVKVSSEDIRTIIVGRNQFAMKAPVVILLVSDKAKFRGNQNADILGAMDAGYVSQNIYLFCAAEGLGTVACAPRMDAEKVQKALGLSDNSIPLIYHPVGYPAE